MTKVLSVVLDHPKFRADAMKVQTLADLFRSKFGDVFDALTDEAAKDFLNSSISDDLKIYYAIQDSGQES